LLRPHRWFRTAIRRYRELPQAVARLSGLFGVGGATFTIPLFVLLLGLTQTEAQGIRLAVVPPAIAIAIPTYIREVVRVEIDELHRETPGVLINVLTGPL